MSCPFLVPLPLLLLFLFPFLFFLLQAVLVPSQVRVRAFSCYLLSSAAPRQRLQRGVPLLCSSATLSFFLSLCCGLPVRSWIYRHGHGQWVTAIRHARFPLRSRGPFLRRKKPRALLRPPLEPTASPGIWVRLSRKRDSQGAPLRRSSRLFVLSLDPSRPPTTEASGERPKNTVFRTPKRFVRIHT